MPRKGQHHSAEAKVKLAKAHLGKKLTDEHRKKISIGGKGRKFTPEHKAKIAAAHRGKSMPLEVRLKLSEKLKGNKINLGRHHTPETKKKLSEAKRGKSVCFTPEHRASLSISKSGDKNPAWKHGDKSKRNPARLYVTWRSMKDRCYNPKASAFKYYGGKGIAICDEWRINYQVFKNWAISHGYQDNLSIDRIDNDKNYCPENCRWITRSENSKHRWNRNKSYPSLKEGGFKALPEHLEHKPRGTKIT